MSLEPADSEIYDKFEAGWCRRSHTSDMQFRVIFSHNFTGSLLDGRRAQLVSGNTRVVHHLTHAAPGEDSTGMFFHLCGLLILALLCCLPRCASWLRFFNKFSSWLRRAGGGEAIPATGGTLACFLQGSSGSHRRSRRGGVGGTGAQSSVREPGHFRGLRAPRPAGGGLFRDGLTLLRHPGTWSFYTEEQMFLV